MFRSILALLALVLSSAAHAQWKEASSTNFLVYSQGSETELREFTEKLEKFDFVLRAYHGVKNPPSPNRPRVFLFPTTAAVGRMMGGGNVAGYYVGRARGLMLVGTRDNSSRATMDAESILLHEYTHHFMYQYFPATYPTWYSEGFAEFWGATKFLPNNIVEVGAPVEYRFGSLAGNQWLSVDKLLTAQHYSDVGDVGLLYAQGWLLVRYMFDNPERRRQLQDYLKLINGGASYAMAMNQAFGDTRRLNSELQDYARRTRFDVVRLPFKTIETGTVAVRTVSAAEQALMIHEIKLSQGIRASEAESFAREVRQIAGRFPDDPFALSILSEAERLAGNREAALAAADRLLVGHPNHPRGLLHKALAQVEGLRAAESSDQTAWDSARQLLVRASQRSRHDPLVLQAYHASFTSQGVLPPEEAQNALYDAFELAPSDGNIRYRLAQDFEQRDMIPEAIAIIRSDAYRMPHRGEESERERKEREAEEEKYRRAGSERRAETAREMYDRLKAKLGESNEPAPAR